MAEPRIPKPITITQIVGVLALGLILLFIVSYTSKAIETYRLRTWRDNLIQEIQAMERQRQALVAEKERRETKAWIDQALKEAGRVPPDVLVVRVVVPETTPTPATPPRGIALLPPSGVEQLRTITFFDNPNWKAWMDLLLHRDVNPESRFQ